MSGSDEWSEDRILAEAERWTWWPPDTAVIEQPEYLLTEWAEGPRRNIVHWTHALHHSGDALVDEVLRRLRSDGRAGVRWWVTPATRPADLDHVLLGHGFGLCERVDILSWNLGSGSDPALPALDVPRGVSADLVRDEPALRTMHTLAASGFGEAPPREDLLRHYARELARQEQAGTRTGFEFIARVDGRPVASAGFTLAGQVARFWGAAALPEARGRGAYRALVAARCAEAHRRGAHIILTKARVGTSGPILRRAGFRAHGQERCFELAW